MLQTDLIMIVNAQTDIKYKENDAKNNKTPYFQNRADCVISGYF